VSKNKLKKFAELITFPNVIQGIENLEGDWYTKLFRNDNPCILELGCGKGEYTIALAQQMPNKNIIGIDVKGARIWKGAKTALELNLTNAAFLRVPVDFIARVFARKKVDEIWLPFPDPFPKERSIKRRLTSSRFLSMYREILVSGGKVHLKTDDMNLYLFSIETVKQEGGEIIRATDGLYKISPDDDLLAVQTTFELKHLDAGKTIKYLCFRL